MTSDKTTSAIADTFKENANNGIKWFQNANAAFIEAQNKQIKAANDIFNKAITSVQGDGKFNQDLGASGKTMVDAMQENIEKFSNMSKAAMKTLTELGKQADVQTISEDAKEVFDIYNKQIDELTKLNQQSFDAVVKQFDASKPSFSPLTENFKKELDAILNSSKESIQTTANSYTKFITSSVDANKEVFDKLIGQMNAGVAANIKAWKDIMNIPVANKETTEKSNSEQTRVSLNGSMVNKKQGVAAAN